jgi:hypothetical protein
MRTSAVERRSRSYAAMQNVAELDEKKPEVRYECTVAIKAAGTAQLKVRLPRAIWKRLGSPPYVDFAGTPDALKILSGRAIKTQHLPGKKTHVFFAIAANKIGLVREKRPATRLDVSIENKCLHLDPLPPEWSLVPPPAPKPKKPKKTILDVETPAPELEQLFIKMSVRKFHKEQVAMFFTVPSELFGRLGDPKRVLIEGTPHHGFRFIPCEDGDGLKINYATGRNVYLQTGLGPRNIDKRERLACPLAAEVKDGVIKTGGAVQDWLQACGEWKPPTKAAPVNGDYRLSRSPDHGAIAAAPNGNGNHAPGANGGGANGGANGAGSVLAGLPSGNTSIEIEALRARMQHALADLRLLKQELEKRTGLKFRMTSGLTFTLDV